MARNEFAGKCYRCGLTVAAGTGHYQRHFGKWRVHHANVPRHGRVTCAAAYRDRLDEKQRADPSAHKRAPKDTTRKCLPSGDEE